MKTKEINSVLKKILIDISPSEKDLEKIKEHLNNFLRKFNEKCKEMKIDAETFVGGSFAKKTLIKKDCYDIDIFVRFDKKHKEISEITHKVLQDFGNVQRIHGSRDYFKIKGTNVPLINPSLKFGVMPDKISSCIIFEIIPVLKIKNSKEAENITDLSYLHVKYINRKTKTKKLLDEIRIAKAFCYASGCYGAESYITGFSGYALELLICYYKSFLKFVKEISKSKEKIIIDIEKHFRNKQEILTNLNSSKLHSPIILIDPTQKHRNALAALSKKTFENFKQHCKEFLKNPKKEFFEIKKINLKKIKENAEKKKYEFVFVKIETDRQDGDIAGSKLIKFYNHLSVEIKKYFEIKKGGFFYDKKKTAKCFFVVKKKKDILIKGPSINDPGNAEKFRKKHKKVFAKNKKIYAREEVEFNIKDFLKKWREKNRGKMGDMSIINIESAE